MFGALTFLPTFMQYVEGRLGDRVRAAHAAAGVRPAHHLDRQRHDRRAHRQVQDVPDRGRR